VLRYGPCVTRGSHGFTCHPHTNHTCLYSPAARRRRLLAGTYCAYPPGDGQAEMIRVDSYIHKVNIPGTWPASCIWIHDLGTGGFCVMTSQRPKWIKSIAVTFFEKTVNASYLVPFRSYRSLLFKWSFVL